MAWHCYKHKLVAKEKNGELQKSFLLDKLKVAGAEQRGVLSSRYSISG